MRRAINGSLYVVVGAIAGAASALGAIDSFGSYNVAKDSPWQAWNLALGGRAHPYALAHFLLSGRLPPVTGQMREFASQRSNDGNVLTADCRYVLTTEGGVPRWWSLAASSGKGQRSVEGFLSSDTAVGDSNGGFTIALSRGPASGNWVQTPASGAFTLIYTVADPATVSKRRSLPTLTITRTGC